jgi:Xaa-Pro aminopeptidase
MNFHDRLADIRARMRDAKLDVLVAVHDGAHFIEKPNPVMVVSGFKSLGPAAAVLRRDGMDVIVTPRWDAERVRERCPDAAVAGAADVVEGVVAAAAEGGRSPGAIGFAGLAFLPSSIESRIAAALPQALSADDIVFGAARAKTDEEIANAREATRIAEAAYAHMLEIARPGLRSSSGGTRRRWARRTISSCSARARAIRRCSPRPGAGSSRATRCSRKSRRAIAGSSRKSAARSRSAARATS